MAELLSIQVPKARGITGFAEFHKGGCDDVNLTGNPKGALGTQSATINALNHTRIR